MGPVKVTDQSFQSAVLDSKTPVMVDFWAEWCGPCRQIAPALEELANEYEGKLTVAKVNIDENPMTPGRFGIRGLPTMMIFQDDKLVSTKTGAMTKSKIAEWVKESAPA